MYMVLNIDLKYQLLKY